MFKPYQLLAPIFLCLVMFSPPGFSQVDDSTPEKNNQAGPDETVESPVASGQEVEVNEDMYRRFMELKDARQQRMILPEDAFKPGSGSQTLDELPEESQKHLRNQLREIILQGDEWQPGDENTDYPYVPSQAAAGNPELQKQEAAAWGELLDSYHKREAQIYNNSARTKAAMASQNGQSGNSGQGAGQSQASSASSGGQLSSTEQTNQQSPGQQQNSPQNEMPDSARITSSSSSAGVSQNAMEFLQSMQNKTGQNNSAQSQEAMDEALANSESESGPGGPETQPNEITEQSEVSRKSSNNSTANNSADNSDAQNMTGVSQNALEFLQQSGQEGNKDTALTLSETAGTSDREGQLADSGDQSDSEQDAGKPASATAEAGETRGATQNALEYVIGEQAAQNDNLPPEPNATSTTSGTLSINDLVNARGVGKGSSPVPPPPLLKEKTPPASEPPDKDDGGQTP